MPLDRYFISHEPLTGDPPLQWDDFRRRRLRRFSQPVEDLELGRYLGCGIDGLVFKARLRGQAEPLAVKIFHFSDRPPRIYVNITGPGTERYWAFERECINRALLDMLATSLGRARAAGRHLYVHPRPETISHARGNLFAFCDEAATKPQPRNFVPVDTSPLIVGCLGWTEFEGSAINKHFVKARVSDQESKSEDQTYPAIVYRFVAEDGVPDIDAISSQADFFHLTGFILDRFTETNWLGKGQLVDFSDIIPYHAGSGWWRPAYYASQQKGFCRSEAELALQRGLLGPPPTPVQAVEAPQLPRRQYKRIAHPPGHVFAHAIQPRGLPLPAPYVYSPAVAFPDQSPANRNSTKTEDG